jgi:anthraniloyl-CoA monooxygenase
VQVVSIGGGPAGLYAAILLRKAFPECRVEVHERNRADDTFGWGVVFSRETLGNLAEADPESYAAIEREFVLWDDIETFFGGQKVVSTGHGFCGLSRKRLLQILQERARSLGAVLRFESEARVDDHLGADLVLGADGVQSAVRSRFEETYRPTIRQGRARFAWLGTTLPLRAFTFVFRENEHGLFQVHAYPFQKDLSTWIVETSEETWKRAGLDRADEAETVAYGERLFAPDLRGHRLLANRSIWRAFPIIRCETWHRGNVVLLGDAVHTAHFSIGSGTKLAMEDAVALVGALQASPDDVPAALATYEVARRPDVERLQRAARVSREWFEDCARWTEQDPTQFTFNLMTRSMRVTWDNLALRDPAFVGRVRDGYAAGVGAPKASDGSTPVPMFTPYEVRGVRLENRVVVSSMCQYSAEDGTPGDWHLVHLGSRATGGVGLAMVEATAVTPEGRITPADAGLWNDAQAEAWAAVARLVKGRGAAAGIQLAHAGRKASTTPPWRGGRAVSPGDGGWEPVAPSPVAFDEGYPTPRGLSVAGIAALRDAFADAARRALAAGFDVVEVHAAHGYLLHEFLSPLANTRSDAYGGSLENRMRLPLEVVRAVREAWPEGRPLFVRISATDWAEGGWDLPQSVELARCLRALGVDLVDCSSGGLVPHARVALGPGYQVPFAETIRREAGIATGAVGLVTEPAQAEAIVASGQADLVLLARALLRDPYWALHAAKALGVDVDWPVQYLRAKA